MHTHHRSLLLGALISLSAPAAAQAPPARFELVNNEVKLLAPIAFEAGSDKLRPESDAALAHIRAYLDQKTYISLLRVEAHADSAGDAAVSQGLSERRAASVVRALVGRGVDCHRLLPVGFGSTKPIADNATPEGKAQNRRVAFVNAALRGRLIGGMPADGGGRVAGDPCK